MSEPPWSAGPSSWQGVRRRTSLAAAAIVFAAAVAWAWGATTPGAAASPSSENGAAVLLSLVIDTATDAATVALWLGSVVGMGAATLRCFNRFARRPRTVAAGVNPREAVEHLTPSRGLTPAATDAPVDVEPIDPLLAFATVAASGIAVLGFVVLLLGLLGQLNRWTAWAVVLAGLALLPWRRARSVRPWLAGRSRGAAVAWLAAVPAAVMFVAASLPPGFLWKPLDPHPYDVVSYHLQVPREWFELGRIVPLAHNSFSYFPAGQEVHDLLLMHLLGGPWAAMYAAQLLSTTLTLLTTVAVIGLLRTLSVGGVIAATSGVMTLCVPWTTMLGGVAYVESGVTLYATLAVAWAALPLGRPARDIAAIVHDATGRDAAAEAAGFSDGRVARRPEEPAASAAASIDFGIAARRIDPWTQGAHRRALLLAGAFAGLAGGVKYTALAMTAAPLLLLWPLRVWRSLGRGVWKPWGVAAVACGVAVSPWLVRNVVWAGNPVFPLGTSVFGRGTFDDDQIARYATAHTPPPAERGVGPRLANAWHRVAADPQYAYGLVPLAAVAAVMAGRSAAGRSAGGRWVAAMLAAAVLVWTFATHEEPRFLAPAIPLAAVLIGMAAGRSRGVGIASVPAMLTVAVVGLGWTVGAMRPTLELGRQGLFRASLQAIEPAAVTEIRKTGGRLALVGDAQAFFYDLPAGRLQYRGVFDVRVPAGATLADGWLGEPVERLRAEGWWVIVSPSELVRLGRTYARLPPAAAPYDDPAGMPVVLPPTGAQR